MADQPKSYKLPIPRFTLSEQVRHDYAATVEQGVTVDHLQNPEFWAHVAAQLSPYDEITVRTDDGTWYAKALVLACGRTWAKVKVLSHHKLSSSDVDMTEAMKIEGFEIKWHGPHSKYVVIRKSDKEVLRDKLDSAETAHAWLVEHTKVTG